MQGLVNQSGGWLAVMSLAAVVLLGGCGMETTTGPSGERILSIDTSMASVPLEGEAEFQDEDRDWTANQRLAALGNVLRGMGYTVGGDGDGLWASKRYRVVDSGGEVRWCVVRGSYWFTGDGYGYRVREANGRDWLLRRNVFERDGSPLHEFFMISNLKTG